MRLENKEPNYCATVIRVNTLVKLHGLDRCLGLPVFGLQSIVSASTELGQLGVVFTAETQLDGQFCKANNLYEDASLNADPNAKGYLKAKGRVRAIKLHGNDSNALFMPLSSLAYLGIDVNQLKEGDCFTHIDGVEVCRKYVVKEPGTPGKVKLGSGEKLYKSRVAPKLMPEHKDSRFWFKEMDAFDDKQWIIVTQKLHGTSVRLANQICTRQLTRTEKWAKWFGAKVQEEEFDYFAGSRRVIKDKARNDLVHFYSSDIYNQCLEQVKHLIPKSWVIYGELIGWHGDKPIQKNYTYRVEQGKFELYVYRIAQINADGLSVDLAWGQIKEFCQSTGLKYVPEIWQGEKKDFNVGVYMDKKYNLSGLKQCVPLADESPSDEGVVVRVNGMSPVFLKAKSPMFIGHETKTLDAGIVDMESEESE